MILPDIHTHTVFCDGKNTPREMVCAAIEKNMSGIGFSGHGHTNLENNYGMSPALTEQYIQQINALKAEFDGKIDIFLGIEADFNTIYDKAKFDYSIGSVHYVGGFDVDNSADILRDAVESLGGPDDYAEQYFEQVSKIKAVTDCDVIGHFDLLTKFDDSAKIFNHDSKRYVTAALTAVNDLLKTDVVFEVNTGAIFRGYRTTPYPAPFILKHILQKGGAVTVTGDAHCVQAIGANFDLALDILRAVGFKSVKKLTSNGFIDVKI